MQALYSTILISILAFALAQIIVFFNIITKYPDYWKELERKKIKSMRWSIYGEVYGRRRLLYYLWYSSDFFKNKGNKALYAISILGKVALGIVLISLLASIVYMIFGG